MNRYSLPGLLCGISFSMALANVAVAAEPAASPLNGVITKDLTGDTYYTRALAVGDLDGDGDIDVITGNQSQPNRVYLNNGTDDPFHGVYGSDLSSDTYATLAVAVADLDGDGDLDVVEGNYAPWSGNPQPNRYYLNNGTQNPFQSTLGHYLTEERNFTRSLAVADFDGSGRPDVVVGNDGHDSKLMLYLNNGTSLPFEGITGTELVIPLSTSVPIYALAVTDVDNDGDSDLAAAVGPHGST